MTKPFSDGLDHAGLIGIRPGQGALLISWLEAHDMSVHATWPREMLEGIEPKAAAAGDRTGGDHG